MTYILGGWQSDFSRNWTREGLDIAGAFTEALTRGLEETGLEPRDIETGHVQACRADGRLRSDDAPGADHDDRRVCPTPPVRRR